MLKQKRRRIPLVKLYLEYSFQRITIIIMLLAFILIALALYFLVDDLDPIRYLEAYDGIHNDYIKNAILIIQIFNAIIITALVIVLVHQAKDFDNLFITIYKREEIIIAKYIVISFITLISAITEWIITMLIAYFKFPRFYISYDRMIEIVYIFLPALLNGALAFLFTIIIPIVFSPFIVLVGEILLKIMCFVSKTNKNNIAIFLPVLDYNNGFIIYNNYLYSIGFILFIMICSIAIYSIKDLK